MIEPESQLFQPPRICRVRIKKFRKYSKIPWGFRRITRLHYEYKRAGRRLHSHLRRKRLVEQNYNMQPLYDMADDLIRQAYFIEILCQSRKGGKEWLAEMERWRHYANSHNVYGDCFIDERKKFKKIKPKLPQDP